MAALEFNFQEFINEITALGAIARSFLAPSSLNSLNELASTLVSIRDAITTSPADWGFPIARPLVTRPSNGAYQVDGKGGLDVFSEVTSIWTIARVAPPGKKANRAERFVLAGKASTRIRIMLRSADDSPAKELAMWRMEIGDDAAPGCHFHTQIRGEDAEAPFPKALDIPRFPNVVFSPAGVVEYLLGELFQQEWAEHIGTGSAHINRWAPIQQKRLKALLSWQLDVVDRGVVPWPTLKHAKPRPDLFC